MSKHSEVLETICAVSTLTLTHTPSQRHDYINSVKQNSLIHLSSLSADFSSLDFSLFVSSISPISMFSRPRPPFTFYAVFSVIWVTYTQSNKEWDLQWKFEWLCFSFAHFSWSMLVVKEGKRDEGDRVKEAEMCMSSVWKHACAFVCVCPSACSFLSVCLSYFYFPHLSLLPWRPNRLLMCCPISQWLSYRCFYHRLAEDH